VTSQGLAQSLAKAGESAQIYGATLDDVIGYTTAIQTATKESGNVIGNSLKTTISRTFSTDSEKVLAGVGIAIKDISGNVRDVNQIWGELAVKFKTLSSEQKQQIGLTIGSRYHLTRFLALMDNWQIVTDATTTSQQSLFSALEENRKHLGSLEAQINKVKSAGQELSYVLGESGLKYVMYGVLAGTTLLVNGLTELSNMGAGGTIAITALVLTMGGLLAKTLSLIPALNAATVALKAFTIATLTNPWIIFGTVVLATIVSIVSYFGHAKQVREEQEKLNKTLGDSTKSFNVLAESINKIGAPTLQNINDIEAQIKRYDELTEVILKSKEAESKKRVKTIDPRTMQVSLQKKNIPEEVIDLAANLRIDVGAFKTYDALLSEITKKQKELADSTEKAKKNSTEYQAQQIKLSQTSLDVANNTNDLVNEYKELSIITEKNEQQTKRYSEVKNMLLAMFPAESKNGQIIIALLEEESKKRVELAETTMAKSREQLIANVKSQQITYETAVKNMAFYQAEIDMLQELWSARSNNTGSTGNWRIAEDLGMAQSNFVETKKEVNSLSDSISKMNDVLNWKPASVAGIGDKDKKDSSSKKDKPADPSYTDPIDALIRESNAQAELSKAKSETITKELEQAKASKDYGLILVKNNELIENQKKAILDLNEAHNKINALKDSSILYSKFGDTSRWFDSNNEASTQYYSELNSASAEVQKTMEAEYTHMEKLRKAWVINTNEIKLATEAQKEFAKQSHEDLFKGIEEQSQALSSADVSKLESSFKNLDIESWIESNITATSEWADVTASLQEELAKLGNPTTLEGQKKYNELLEASATKAATALKAQQELEKAKEKAGQDALFEQADEDIKDIMSQIDDVDQMQKLGAGGFSSQVPKIKINIIPDIDLDSVDEAIQKVVDETKSEFTFKAPTTFINVINNEFTNALSKAQDNIIDLKQNIKNLGEIKPENQGQVDGFLEQWQEELDKLSNKAKDTRESLKKSLDAKSITEEEFNSQTQAVNNAELTVLAIPRIEMSAEYQTELETLKKDYDNIPVTVDTVEANEIILALIANAEKLITANIDSAVASQVIADLTKSEIKTIYIQTVTSSSSEDSGDSGTPARATGDSNFVGGKVIVGEEGKELISEPDGTTYLSGDKSELRDLPKGTVILPNRKTENLLKSLGVPAYSSGTGDIKLETLIDSQTEDLEKVNKLIKSTGNAIAKVENSIKKYINPDGTVNDKYASDTKIVDKVNIANATISNQGVNLKTYQDQSDKLVSSIAELKTKVDLSSVDSLVTRLKYINEGIDENSKVIKTSTTDLAKYVDKDGNIKKKYLDTEKSTDKQKARNAEVAQIVVDDRKKIENAATSKNTLTNQKETTSTVLGNLRFDQANDTKLALYSEALEKIDAGIVKVTDSMEKYKNEDGSYKDNATTRAGKAKLQEYYDQEKSIQLSMKQIITDKFNAEYEGYDKLQKKSETQVSDLQKILEYQKLIGASVEDQLESEQSILETKESEQKSLLAEQASLEAKKTTIVEKAKADLSTAKPDGYTQADLDSLLEHNSEYNLTIDKLTTVHSQVLDYKNSIMQVLQEIGQIRADAIIKPFTDSIAQSQHSISILGNLDTLDEKKKAYEYTQEIGETLQDESEKIAKRISEIQIKLNNLDPSKAPEEIAKLKAELDKLTSTQYQLEIEIITNLDSVISQLNNLDVSGIQEAFDAGEDWQSIIPITLEGQKKYNELLIQQAENQQAATKAQEEYNKTLEKTKLDQLLSNADGQLKDINDAINLVDHFVSLGKDGTSKEVPTIDYVNDTPHITPKTPEQAGAEVENPANKTDYVPPKTFVDFINKEFSDALKTGNAQIAGFNAEIDALGPITEENVGKFIALTTKISDVGKGLNQTYLDARKAVENDTSLSEDERNTKLQQIDASNISILSKPQIQITSDAKLALKTAGINIATGIIEPYTDAISKLDPTADIAKIAEQYATASGITMAKIDELNKELNDPATTEARKIVITAEIGQLKLDLPKMDAGIQEAATAMANSVHAEFDKNAETIQVDILKLDPTSQKEEITKLNEKLVDEITKAKAAVVTKMDELNDELNNPNTTKERKVVITAELSALKLDLKKLNTEMATVQAEIDKTAKETSTTIKVKSDVTSAKKSIKEVENGKYKASVKVNAETTEAQKAIDALKKDATATITVNVVEGTTKSSNKSSNNAFAKGTLFAPEGEAIVGEKGREIISEPDGKTYLSGDKAELRYLPEGTSVIPNKETEEFLKSMGIQGFEDGKGKSLADLFKIAGLSDVSQLGNLSTSALLTLKQGLYKYLIETAGTSITELTTKLNAPENIDSVNEDGTVNYKDNEATQAIVSEIKTIQAAEESAQTAIKALIVEKYEAEWAGFDKLQTNAEWEIKSAENNLEYSKLIGKNNEDIVAQEEAILAQQKAKEASLLAQQISLKAQRDGFAVDSLEYNTLDIKLKSVTDALGTVRTDVYNTASEIANLKFEAIIFPFKEVVSDLEVLSNFLDEDNFAGNLDNIRGQIVAVSSEIYEIKSELSKISNDSSLSPEEKAKKIGEYTTKLEEAEIALNNLAKSEKDWLNKQLSDTFDKQLEAVEKVLFNGSTESEAQEALQDKIDLQNKFISGAEKDLEISKIRNRIVADELTLTAEQTALLDSQGDIERTSLERLGKQLDIQQALLKVENLKGQKTIQQMTKNADGNWNFEYVADQDAILEAENDLATKRVDLITWERDQINSIDKEKLDEKGKYLSKLKVITDKAQNGEYDSYEDFANDMSALNQKYLGGMGTVTATEWQGIFDSTQTNISSMQTAFTTYTTEIEALATRMKLAYQDILDAQELAKKVVEYDPPADVKIVGTPKYSEPEPNIDFAVGINDPNSLHVDDSTGIIVNFTPEEATNMSNWAFNQVSKTGENPTAEDYMEEFDLKRFKSGGYTGNSEGMAYLDEQEIVLDKSDTFNLLKSVQINKSILDSLEGFDFKSVMGSITNIRGLSDIFKAPIDMMKSIGSLVKQTSQTVENHFHINKLELPNVNNQNGVDSLINGLNSYAIQYSKK